MLTDTDSPDKRLLILRAALQLLATRGFHGFSMKQLADQAGVAAGTLYLYFRDRDYLIRQLHQEIILTFAHHALAGFDPNQPPRQRHRNICQNLWRFCCANPDLLLSKEQFDHLPPDILRDHHQGAWQAFKPLEELFEQCRQEGMVKSMSNEMLATLSIDPLISLARKYHLGLATLREDDVKHFIDSTWDAIARNAENMVRDSENLAQRSEPVSRTPENTAITLTKPAD
jgi:TetR/AcrR family transcriptional repressor of multidrug resistance operon